MAQLRSFISNSLLQGGQARFYLLGMRVDPPAKDVQLDLNAQQSLENAVVEVARNPGALCFDRPGAQMTKEKYVLQRTADMPGDLLEPGKVILAIGQAGRLTIHQEKAPRCNAALIKRDREQIAN